MTLWRTDLSADEWDARLALMGGHPLQSALWGDVRRAVDGIHDHRWAAFHGEQVTMMARVEERAIPLFGRAAWLPRGPVAGAPMNGEQGTGELLGRLRAGGYVLCIDDRYANSVAAPGGIPLHPKPRTAVIDLTVGREAVWSGLDATMRYGVRTAAKGGAVIEESTAAADVSAFFALCSEIGRTKGFELSTSEPLMQRLIGRASNGVLDARLFVARVGAELAAGACVIRSGTSLHYFWGGVDRRFAKLRTGEAVQWRVIDWALDNGIDRYDLEGIDPVNNPGTYQFKMKMGAVELDLPGRRAHPLNMTGRIALSIGQRLGRI